MNRFTIGRMILNRGCIKLEFCVKEFKREK